VSQENSNGLRAFETVGQFLEEDSWYPQRLEDQYAYRVGFAGSNGQLPCFARVNVDIEQFVFYVYAPVKVAEEARPQAAEFLTRANYGMRIGNFEMDYGDGEVRYKSSLDFEDAVLTAGLVRNAIYPAVRMMDDYLPGLLGVIYGGKTPADAIAEIEG
jgi:hypothetical protein